MQDKNQLRQIYRQARSALTHEQRASATDAITSALVTSVSWHMLNTVHVFLSSEQLLEVNTWPLLKYLWQYQPHVKTVTNFFSKNSDALQCRIVTSASKFVSQTMGLVVPVDGEMISPNQIDLMILPMLTCDFKGFRLGYGKAYYDKLLNLCRPDMHRIGINFFAPTPELLPAEPHDQRIQTLVTPQHFYHFDFIG